MVRGGPRMSRLLTVLGVAALLGAATLALASRPPADVGRALAAPTATPAPRDVLPSPVDLPPAPEAVDQRAVGTRSARLADLAASPVVPPARIALPSLGLDAPIVPVGVEPDGQMEVPGDVGEVGWYRHGPASQDGSGSMVLAGHVDSRTEGRGVFFDLRRLAPGDEVRVVDADGTRTTWVVTGRSTIAKPEVPLEELFRRDGPPRLVLVTCGGDFDADRGSYRSNVVVIAEPSR